MRQDGTGSMRWTSNSGLLTLAALACAALPGAASAAMVVLSGTGGRVAARYPEGMVIEASTLKLEEGEAITVAVDGQIRTIRGPSSRAVPAARAEDRPWIMTLVAALRDYGTRRDSRIGASRGPEPAEGTTIWRVATDRTARICADRSAPLELWRSDADRARSARIENLETGAVIMAHWPAGIHLTPWPDKQISAGTYRLAMSGDASTMVTITVVPIEPTTVGPDMLIAFSRNRCDSQIRTLIKSR